MHPYAVQDIFQFQLKRKISFYIRFAKISFKMYEISTIPTLEIVCYSNDWNGFM